MLRRGISRFPNEILMSHSIEEFFRGALLCFRKISVIDKTTDKIEGGREVVPRISCKVFCLTVPEKFVKETFSASLSSGIETFFA